MHDFFSFSSENTLDDDDSGNHPVSRDMNSGFLLEQEKGIPRNSLLIAYYKAG